MISPWQAVPAHHAPARLTGPHENSRGAKRLPEILDWLVFSCNRHNERTGRHSIRPCSTVAHHHGGRPELPQADRLLSQTSSRGAPLSPKATMAYSPAISDKAVVRPSVPATPFTHASTLPGARRTRCREWSEARVSRRPPLLIPNPRQRAIACRRLSRRLA